MSDALYDMADHERFVSEQFVPFLERFDRHIEADDRRYEQTTVAINRISTAIEVSAAVQQAQVAQTDRIFKSFWTRAAVVVAACSPLVTAMVALWVALR